MTAHVIPARPSVPAPYISGRLTLTPGKPHNLLELIHDQIGDSPGTSVELVLWADPNNVAPIFCGAFSQIAGPLSVHQFAFCLTPMGEPRRYHASFPGTGTPAGVLQVFSEAPGGRLHVELTE